MSSAEDATTPFQPTDRPRLMLGARLQLDRLTGRQVLLFPEGMLQLNATGASILELCDGERSVQQVAALLAEKFTAPADQLYGDVAEYLNQLRRRRYVEIG